jgi:hypothetical protein
MERNVTHSDTHRQHRPLDSEVQKVQADTGMDYLQAYRHLQSRHYAAEHVAAKRRAAVQHCIDSWQAKAPPPPSTEELLACLRDLVNVAGQAYDVQRDGVLVATHPTITRARYLLGLLNHS